MNYNYLLSMKYPSTWWGAKWREALPLGNGIMGASVYGGVWEETIMITHTDLWWKSVTPDLPDVSSVLPDIRKCLLDNQPLLADKIMVQALQDNGYYPKLAYPLPLCDIKIETKTEHAFKNYQRTLNMETGEALVQWQDGKKEYIRTCFVSRADNTLILKMTTKDGAPFSVSLSLGIHDIEDAKVHTDNLEKFLPTNRQQDISNELLTYCATNDDGTDFGAVARVLHKDGAVTYSESNMHIKDTTEITILLQSFVQGDRNNSLKSLVLSLKDICTPYEELLKEHVQLHSKLFKSATLEIDQEQEGSCNEELLLNAYQGTTSNEMLEKMWNYGRYLLISGSTKGGNPCHLYGLWCGDYYGEWTFNMVNENLQMIYWHALSGNMPELLLPVFDYMEKLMPDFRTNAKNLYGCRGIFIPGPTVPDSGLIKNVSPHLLYWTGGGGWVGQHYYDYFLYTGDKDFLENRALPFLEEVALFYEDFFIEDLNGFYMTIPSNSPENTPSNLWGGNNLMGPQMQTTMNATMDFAIAKEVLTHLIEGYDILEKPYKKTSHWKKMLAKIPPYEINCDGAIKEWMHEFYEDNYKHRHQSHIYPVFPGNEIQEEDNPELYQAFVVAVKKRLEIGINQQTGWSLAHMSNNYARMKQGNLAIECLDLMCQSMVMNNFTTLHNDWRNMGVGMNMVLAPVQIDANMGISSAINEMLLQSYANKILILPALPDRLAKGSVHNLLTRQGILVHINWNTQEETVSVTLNNTKEPQLIELILPKTWEINDKRFINNKTEIDLSTKQLHITFPSKF